MMGKTHLAVGLAAALAVAHPATALHCLPAVMGGALGSVICDIDNLRNKGKNDSIMIQLTAAALTAGMLALDIAQGTGLWPRILRLGRDRLFVGCAAFVLLWIVGFLSNHRGFTHSIAAGALFSQAVWTLCPPAATPFAAAYAAHIAVDLLNKKGLRLLWPMKGGVCFDLCYSDRTVNALLFELGLLGTAFLIANASGLHII